MVSVGRGGKPSRGIKERLSMNIGNGWKLVWMIGTSVKSGSDRVSSGGSLVWAKVSSSEQETNVTQRDPSSDETSTSRNAKQDTRA